MNTGRVVAAASALISLIALVLSVYNFEGIMAVIALFSLVMSRRRSLTVMIPFLYFDSDVFRTDSLSLTISLSDSRTSYSLSISFCICVFCMSVFHSKTSRWSSTERMDISIFPRSFLRV